MTLIGLLLPADMLGAQNLPDGLVDELVVGDIPSPTALAWLPPEENGDLLITGKGGRLYRWDGAGAADPILDLSDTVCSGSEMGLLGVAVDPRFGLGERFIYLYYTDKREGSGCGSQNRANRVSRFAMGADGSIAAGSKDVLIDRIPAPGGNHNAGDLQFGGDGLLYISVGDGGQDLQTGESQSQNGNARRRDLLNGKILRIATDGTVPPSNPFTGANSVACASAGRAPGNAARVDAEKKSHQSKKRKRKKRRNRPSAVVCQEIFATGLRNPFRIAFDPNATGSAPRFFINDVGASSWEEIDEAKAGADYGWNRREGPCQVGVTRKKACTSSDKFVSPVFAYSHGTGCHSITGGAFVPNNGGWPAAYDGAYLYADYICGKLFALRGERPFQSPEVFASGLSAIHLAFGPDHALYYTTFDRGGEVHRIAPERGLRSLVAGDRSKLAG
jgi:glucose/arabinose dehydrogenase